MASVQGAASFWRPALPSSIRYDQSRMRWIIALFGCVWSLGAAQILAWYPLKPGNMWTYEHEVRDLDPKRPKITRWTTLESIGSLVSTPEGTVVKRDFKTLQGQPDGSWIATRGQFHYLLRQDCLYFLNWQDWVETAHQLSAAFQNYLRGRNVSPDLCFPLQIGKHWSAASSNEWAWNVAGLGCGQTAFCADSVSASDFHLVAPQASSGGTAHLWFRKEVGITGQWWSHNGTYSELRIRLVKFQPVQH